jgi:hypothetical protein
VRRRPVPHNPYRMRRLLSRQLTKQVSEPVQAGGVRARHGLAYLLLLLFCFVATSYLIRMADFAMGGAAALLLFGVVVQRQPFTLGGKPGYWLLAYAGFVCLSVFTSVWLGPSIDGTKAGQVLASLHRYAERADDAKADMMAPAVPHTTHGGFPGFRRRQELPSGCNEGSWPRELEGTVR